MILGPVVNPPQSPGVNDSYGPLKTKEESEAEEIQKMHQDSGGVSIEKLARELGMEINDQTKDYLYQYYLNDKASEAAWNRSVFAAQNQYQWLVDDLKKAGLNPFLAISGMNGALASSSAGSTSGGLITSKQNNAATNQTNLLRSLFQILGTIVGIALFKKA